MRTFLAAAFVAASLLLGARPAIASCARQTLSEQIARADVIAFGTVTSVRMTLVAASGVVTFRPERVLKGTLTRSVQVYLGPTHGGAISSVDYQAASPQRHTLYLRDARDGSFETDACSGSHDGAPTDDERSFLGSGAPGVAPPDPAPSLWLVFAIPAGFAVALFAILMRLRRGARGS